MITPLSIEVSVLVLWALGLVLWISGLVFHRRLQAWARRLNAQEEDLRRVCGEYRYAEHVRRVKARRLVQGIDALDQL